MGDQSDNRPSAPAVWHGVQQILAPIFVPRLLATYVARCHFQPALHCWTREATVEPRLHMKKAVEADEFARFVKADQVAHPTEQRNVSDAVVSAHHPVATREPFVEDTEQPR